METPQLSGLYLIMPQEPDKELLQSLWHAGVTAVGGQTSVSAALRRLTPPAPDQIIAVGKAAAAMASAAVRHYGPDIPTLVVTKYDHSSDLPGTATIIEAAHPVPDQNSILAGKTLVHTVMGMPSESHLLFLVSGGASSLAELPNDGLSLSQLATENSRMLSAGLDIHAMNAHRKSLSQIKGGKLLARFPGKSVTVLAVSDVEGDALSVVGSGIGDAPENPPFVFDPHIVASNHVAREAAVRAAEHVNLTIRSNAEVLYDDVITLATRLAAQLKSSPTGLHVFGGEPTVILPEHPGRGGRNQALALLLAREISGTEGLTIIVAGTDGSDGPTDAAGAIVDGTTWGEGAEQALARADSGTWLDHRGALLRTGPTGTNVMDLMIALRT